MTATKMIQLEKEIRDLKDEMFRLQEKSRNSWVTNGGFAQEQADWDKERGVLKQKVISLSLELHA